MHLTQNGNNLHFFYDASGKPAVVDFNGVKYGYIVNLQGDVLGLIDGSGNEVVKYTYDAWGKVLSTTGSLAATLGAVQPFRYRGYVYDVETGLYYLRSRYYNPVWQKFVNADAMAFTTSNPTHCNVFSYTANSPVIFLDFDGAAPYTILPRDTQKVAVLLDALDEYRSLSGGKELPLFFEGATRIEDVEFIRQQYPANYAERLAWDTFDVLGVDSSSVGTMIEYGVSLITKKPYAGDLASKIDMALQSISASQVLVWEQPHVHECKRHKLILKWETQAKGKNVIKTKVPSILSLTTIYEFSGCDNQLCDQFHGFSGVMIIIYSTGDLKIKKLVEAQ